MMKELLIAFVVLVLVSCAGQKTVEIPQQPAPSTPSEPAAEAPSQPSAEPPVTPPATTSTDDQVAGEVDNLTTDMGELDQDVDPDLSSFEDW